MATGSKFQRGKPPQSLGCGPLKILLSPQAPAFQFTSTKKMVNEHLTDLTLNMRARAKLSAKIILILMPKPKDNYCESVVRCDRRLTFAEAEKAMAEGSGLGATLQKLSLITDLFEEAAFQKGQSFPFEHWEPQVGLQLPVAGFLKTRRIVECLSFMVNLYAGQVLDRQSLWQSFLSAQTDADFTLRCRLYAQLCLWSSRHSAPPGFASTTSVPSISGSYRGANQ